jgi:hypothetical protein
VKDPRLENRLQWQLPPDQGRERGEKAFRALGDSIELVPKLVEVFRGSDELPTLPDPLARDVERLFGNQDELQEGSWFGIAAALAALACETPDGAGIAASAERLGRAPWWVGGVFDDACAEQIRRQPERDAEWRRALGRPPELPIPPAAPAGRVVTYQPMPEWEIADPFELWNVEGDAPILLVAGHAPFRVLRRLDPDAWLHAVDAWEDARLVDAALWGDELLHDSEAIVRALTMAAPAFAEDGSWTRRVAAVVLAGKIIDHATALNNALRLKHIRNHANEATNDDELKSFMHDELPALFARAWNVLLGRPDGLVIGAALHARLCAPRSAGSAWEQYRVEPTAARCLADALAKRATDIATLRGLWVWRKEMPRTACRRARRDHRSPLCAISSALDVVRGRSAQLPELFDWFAETLSPVDSDWSWFANMLLVDPFLVRLSEVLAADASLLGRCEELYVRLESSRRRSEFDRQEATNGSHESSVVALGMVLSLIERARRTGRTDLAPHAEHAFESAVRLEFVSSPGWDSPLSTRLLLVSAIVVRAAVRPSSIADSLSLVVSDPALMATTGAGLIRALGHEVVETAFGTVGLTLREAERLAHAWASATGRCDDKAAVEGLRKVLADVQTADARLPAEPAP